jgi:hypothetical protein
MSGNGLRTGEFKSPSSKRGIFSFCHCEKARRADAAISSFALRLVALPAEYLFSSLHAIRFTLLFPAAQQPAQNALDNYSLL